MRLDELFDDSIDVVGDLRKRLLPTLLKLAGSGMPYTTVDQIAAKMKKLGGGVVVTRALVMKVLDPEEIPVVKSIEGDRINFTIAAPPETDKAEQEAEKQADKINNMAKTQAKKSIGK